LFQLSVGFNADLFVGKDLDVLGIVCDLSSFELELVYVILLHDVLVDGVGDSVPLELVLESEFLVHGEADDLEAVLLEENVHHVEGFGVELRLDLEQPHVDLTVVLLVRLQDLDGEHRTQKQEQRLLHCPHQHVQEHHGIVG